MRLYDNAMRVLVAGGLGFIGSHLTLRLLAEGHEVNVVDNGVSTVPSALAFARTEALRSEVFCEPLSISDFEGVTSSFLRWSPDVVVNAAAIPGVRESFLRPSNTLTNNLTATIGACEVAKSLNSRLVFISSSSVYGNRQGEMQEDQPLNPVSPYGVSKVLGEEIVECYSRTFGIPAISARPFTVYGELCRHDMMPYRLVESAFTGKEVPYYGDDFKRDWSYVGDVCERIVKIITHEPSPSNLETFNLGSGNPTTLGTFRQLVEAATGKQCNLLHATPPPAEVRSTHSSPTKFEQHFGAAATTPNEVGVYRMVESFNKFWDSH